LVVILLDLHFKGFLGGFLGHFFIPGSYTNFIYYGDFDNTGLLFEVFFKINYILWAFGAALFILAFELSIKRTKYVLTIIQIPLILLLIILPYSWARRVHHYALYPINTTIIIAVIVLLSKESRFELKAISIYQLDYYKPNMRFLSCLMLPSILSSKKFHIWNT